MGRVLALDIGRRRIGVALSDPDQRLALPRGAIDARPHSNPFGAIAALIESEDVERVVVGLPLALDGREGDMAAYVRGFVAGLGKRVSVPIELRDERMTSAWAERTLAQTGGGRDHGRRKERVDALAAQAILDDWLRAKTVTTS